MQASVGEGLEASVTACAWRVTSNGIQRRPTLLSERQTTRRISQGRKKKSRGRTGPRRFFLVVVLCTSESVGRGSWSSLERFSRARVRFISCVRSKSTCPEACHVKNTKKGRNEGTGETSTAACTQRTVYGSRARDSFTWILPLGTFFFLFFFFLLFA